VEPIVDVRPLALILSEALEQLQADVGRLAAPGNLAGCADLDIAHLARLVNDTIFAVIYLEGNQRFTDLAAVRRMEDDLAELLTSRLFEDILRAVPCFSDEAERLRQRLLDVTDVRRRRREVLDAQLWRVTEAAQQAERCTAAAHTDLVRALTHDDSLSGTALGVYQLLRRTPSRSTREKLGAALDARRVACASGLVESIDLLSVARRTEEETRWSCFELELTQRESFIETYVTRAIVEHDRFAAAFALRVDEPLTPHVGRVLSEHRAAGPATSAVSLGRCLDLIGAVAAGCLGLSVARGSASPLSVGVRLTVRSGDVTLGCIIVDVLPDNGSLPLQSRPLTPPTALPTSRALARGRVAPDGDLVLTLAAAQALLHEIGHSLEHLLQPGRPLLSGFDGLPLERLEHVSMWFEKWIFHPVFAALLGEQGRASWSADAGIRVLEFLATDLERAVIAATDLYLSQQPTAGLRAAFERAVDRFDLGRRIAFAVVPDYFDRPLFRAHPGGSVAYLWGATFSAASFAPQLRSTKPVDATAVLGPGLDAGCADQAGDIDAVYAFYDLTRATHGTTPVGVL